MNTENENGSNGSYKRISLVIVDDHAVVREGLGALLACERDIEVVGEAADGREAVALCLKAQPDVALMDVIMPRMNGCEAARRILKSLPSTKIIALTACTDDDCVDEMMQAGARGFLGKRNAAGELLKAVRDVHKGLQFFSPQIAKRLADRRRRSYADGRPAVIGQPLTSRETEVLQLIAEGFMTKQIAPELGISVKTVEKHRQQVMNKLHLHNIADLTRYFIAKGVNGTWTKPANLLGEATEPC